MDTWLYTTTDRNEIEELFGNSFRRKRISPIYHSIDSKTGEVIKKRIGFNPMLAIQFDARVPVKTLEPIAVSLLRGQRFAHIQNGDYSRSFLPYWLLPDGPIEVIKGPHLM